MAACLSERGSPIVAVGSERPGAAQNFAADHGVETALESHAAVAEHPDVDVVYVATTNDLHLTNVLTCLEHGKPVLCEKPIALNGTQTREMFDTAARAGVFVMEAMWMRFQPFLAVVDGLVAEREIGDLIHIGATLGFRAPLDAGRRWVSSELGGGSILDLGVYPMTLIHHLVGSPVSFHAGTVLGPTGVDVEASVISRHGSDATASWTSTFRADTANEAVLSGREGRIRIAAPFHHSPRLNLERDGRVVATHDTSYEGHGFEFEVAEVERCVAGGLVESPIRPHKDTLAVMDWMDAVRARCGISYPAEG